ncbi:MAG: 4-hydroxybutyrate CoA-transferase [Candidatus Binatia bacterium]|nr:MAG: 4-hydroxybutyrate CoA-transferase [Candidatus Binatia bacterium]
MKVVTPEAAVRAIPDGSRVLLPHGALDPVVLYDALREESPRFHSLELHFGLHFGTYSFLEPPCPNFRYVTWQATPRLRPHLREGRVEVLPLRFRDVVRVFSPRGPLRPDVLFLQTTLPRRGRVSLGISVSVYRELLRSTPLVIAEFNRNMPWTCGASEVPLEDIVLAVESDAPLCTYESREPDAAEERVVEQVLRTLPNPCWLQVGIGTIPEAVLANWSGPSLRVHSGIATDGLLAAARRARDYRAFVGEVAGTRSLYDFVHENPRIEFRPTDWIHDVCTIGRLDRFVSVNGAVEVDLQGQANVESVAGVPVSGPGGALEFVEGAWASRGGLSVVALTSTTKDGKRSKIVPFLEAGTPVAIPRFCVDAVVTEFGVARLRGRTLLERARALLRIAHPDFREELAAAASDRFGRVQIL